jgi:50S ribosomal protein L16 3-hydroxylase
MHRKRPFLGGLSPEQFLSQYWQKRPLLIRQALPGYRAPLSAEELAGLACEPGVESRLIVQKGQRYELEDGPLTEARFSTLGKRRWTFLVQDLDQHVPDVHNVLHNLDFLPSWRIDDVMASYAADGGSVGPHYDEYDVFLLQVEGKRRWQVSTHYDRDDLVAASQLKLLKHFRAEKEWLLEPGDMLYLPPHVAHYGVAEGPCVTYSLGCRAPSVAELVQHITSHALRPFEEKHRYQDADLKPARDAHCLDAASLARARQVAERALTLDAESWTRAFGSLVTQPKALFTREAIEPLAPGRVRAKLNKAAGLQRRMGSRWLYSALGEARLFVDGFAFNFGRQQAFARELCSRSHFAQTDVSRWAAQPAKLALLSELVRLGFLE